jgi:hypothetical protein
MIAQILKRLGERTRSNIHDWEIMQIELDKLRVCNVIATSVVVTNQWNDRN